MKNLVLMACTLMLTIHFTSAQNSDAKKPVAPKYISDLKAEKSNYIFTFTMGQQKMQMDMTREVKIEDGKWKIIDKVTAPQFTVTDEGTFQLKTLKPLHRITKQGPLTIDVDFTKEGASGTKDQGDGTKVPFTSTFGSHVVSDGAGSDLLIARLPIKENYNTVLEIYDGASNALKTMEIKVVGKENVTVPAGTFETYKIDAIEIGGPNKFTVWMSTKELNMIRTEAVIPEMGNAIVVAELK